METQTKVYNEPFIMNENNNNLNSFEIKQPIKTISNNSNIKKENKRNKKNNKYNNIYNKNNDYIINDNEKENFIESNNEKYNLLLNENNEKQIKKYEKENNEINFSLIINPFQNDSQSIQNFYKIFSIITLSLLFLVIFIILYYK